MPININIQKDQLTNALQSKIAQLKRQQQKEINQLIKDIVQKDINEIQKALNTITETK